MAPDDFLLDRADLRVSILGHTGRTRPCGVAMRHVPTGIRVHVDTESSTARNKSKAVYTLREMVWEHLQAQKKTKEAVAPFKLNTDRNVAVSTAHYFEPMSTCPVGVKLILLGPGDVGVIAQWDGRDPQWGGWFPMPKKRRPE